MKTRILRSAAALLLVCALCFSLTGCDKLDYGHAVDLYNAGKFDAAAEIFYELGNYEDSAALHTLSQYWSAIALMEEGNFQEALPRFIKLGSYEDSAQRVTECTYQIAIAAFEAGNYTDAQIHFREVAEYRQSQEYLRRINWQGLYDAIAAVGFNHISGFSIEKELDGKHFSISAMHHDHATMELILSVDASRRDPFFYHDDLILTLTSDSTIATFEAGSGFGMDYLDGWIGSSQTATGTLDITTCTPETKLVVETYSKHVEDNLGNITDVTDPAENLMEEVMAENLYDLLTVIPELLKETGIELTLNDIGFYAI